MSTFTRYLLSAIALSSSVLATEHLTAAPPRHTAAHALRQDTSTLETTSPLPLTDYNYPYSAIPEKVNPYAIGRGPQSGYNICNSTTEGPNSDCQTMVVNNLTDFCLWGSPTPDGEIGDVEAIVVAYCTQPGHGTRVMPAGTITGAQFMRTSAYIQITGTLNQTGVGLSPTDYGGELDPHGADLLGNPLGGLVYSTGLPSGDNKTYNQVTSWNNFVGSNTFCIKLCDPTVTSPNYCQNIYDLIGCNYNMPATYKEGEFTSCEGDLQEVVGTYTSNGQTYTWSQPSSLPATSTLPWTPVIPASSNCVTYSSEELFGGSSTTSTSASATPTGTGASASSGRSGSSGTGTGSTGGASPSQTGSTSAAGKLSVGSGVFAVLAAALALL